MEKIPLLVRIVIITLLIYCLIIVGVYLFNQLIIYQGKALSSNHTFKFDAPFEELFLKTEDQETIHGLYFPVDSNARGIVLYFHGNRDNLDRWGKFYEDFHALDYDFLAIDYRGYGKSTGKPSEEGLYMDAQAAYQWARTKYEPDQIVIFGRSLGSGVASNLAMKQPARKLVLETPYHSMTGVFRIQSMILWLPFPLKNAFPNDEHLTKVEIPTMIFHGTNDRVVPMRSAIKLKPLLQEESNFIIIEGGKHRGLNQFELYRTKLTAFLHEE